MSIGEFRKQIRDSIDFLKVAVLDEELSLLWV
jgi:hypothetical protein